MYKRVEQGKKCAVATWENSSRYQIDKYNRYINYSVIQEIDLIAIRTRCKFQAHPHRERHAAMMYDMQRRNVLVLLAKNEEECVKELCEFWYVVPPTDIDHLQR